jgi:serine/threonine protein kinase
LLEPKTAGLRTLRRRIIRLSTIPVALVAGSRLGPYEIVSLVGAGGEVYKAKDTRLDRIVAIKILPPELATDPQFRERFDREAARSHSWIIPTFARFMT